jgi:hypothetical protein
MDDRVLCQPQQRRCCAVHSQKSIESSKNLQRRRYSLRDDKKVNFFLPGRLQAHRDHSGCG